MTNKIPFPEFTSYMHERCDVARETLEDRQKRWKNQPTLVIALDAVMSRVGVKGGFFKGVGKYVFYKFVVRIFRHYFKAFNNLKIFGVENIPKDSGGIFYVNHPGSYDPIIMAASIPDLIFGGFVSWGNGWFADLIEMYYGLSSLRRFDRQHAIEYMIRLLLQKNKFFALWPEGHPHLGPIEQGYSTIIPVYAALNHDKDRIPFLPV
nr:hypothetical protein [Candidatus Sigynarchaeota archaeon]